MATIAQNKDEQSTMNVLTPNENKGVNNNASLTPTIPQLGAESAIQSVPQQNKQQNVSGQFASLNKLLAVNKQAGQKIGEAIQQKTQKEASDIGKAISEKLGQYQTQVGQTKTDIQQAQAAGLGAVQNIQAGQTLTPQQITQYQSILKGQTTTGQQLGVAPTLNLAEEQQKQQALQQRAQQAQTASGTFGMLQDFFKAPQKRYTEGQQQLDTAFLRRNPMAVQQTQQALQATSNQPQKQIQEAQSLATQRAKELGETVEQAKQNIISAREQAQSQLQSQLQQQANVARAQREKLQAEINQALTNRNLQNLSQEAKKGIGLSIDIGETPNIEDLIQNRYITDADVQRAKDWSQKYGVLTGTLSGLDLGAYITGRAVDPSTQEYIDRTATAQQLQQARQLATIAGNPDQNLILNEQLVGRGLDNQSGIKFEQDLALQKAQEILNKRMEEAAIQGAKPSASLTTANRESIWHDLDTFGSESGSAKQIEELYRRKAVAEGVVTPEESDDIGLVTQRLGFPDIGAMYYSGSYELAAQRARQNALRALLQANPSLSR